MIIEYSMQIKTDEDWGFTYGTDKFGNVLGCLDSGTLDPLAGLLDPLARTWWTGRATTGVMAATAVRMNATER